MSNFTDLNNDINHTTENLSGCDMIPKLWKTAIECNIEKPGITGTPSRVNNFVKCGNLLEFFNIATQKCWEERTRHSREKIDYPPQLHVKHTHSSSKSYSGTTTRTTGTAGVKTPAPGLSKSGSS